MGIKACTLFVFIPSMIIWRNNGTDNIHIDIVQASKYKDVPNANLLNTYLCIEHQGGGTKYFLSSHYLDASEVAQPRITTLTDRFCLYSVIDSTLLGNLTAGFYTARFFAYSEPSFPTDDRQGLEDDDGATIADQSIRNGTFLVSEVLLNVNTEVETLVQSGASTNVVEIAYPTTDIEE